MTSKRQRKKVARQLPPAGTTLTATYRGQTHTAVIVEAKDRPGPRAVQPGGHTANGWLFWQPAETGAQ
jgi:hypothetical protein